MKIESGLFAIVATCLLLGPYGCQQENEQGTAILDPGNYDSYESGEITFLDDVQANATVEDHFGQLVFQNLEGQEYALADLAPGKSLVVVITRGFTDPICPYCTTQVARLIGSYEEITAAGAEVVVIYPIAEQADGVKLNAFLDRSREVLNDPGRPVPFPVLLDVKLTNVDRLGIRKNLSKPATYIIDVAGKVRFAYVGESLGDRPSVAAVLAELKKLPTTVSHNEAESTPEQISLISTEQ